MTPSQSYLLAGGSLCRGALIHLRGVGVVARTAESARLFGGISSSPTQEAHKIEGTITQTSVVGRSRPCT